MKTKTLNQIINANLQSIQWDIKKCVTLPLHLQDAYRAIYEKQEAQCFRMAYNLAIHGDIHA